MNPEFSLQSSLLHLLHRATQIADDHFASQSGLDGLTSRQLIVLAAISGREGASQTDIADVTGIDRSTLTDLIGRMQSKGLVQRNRARHDARSYEVRLTAAGRTSLASAIPIARVVDEQILAAIPDAKRREFTELLQRILGPVPGAVQGLRAADG